MKFCDICENQLVLSKSKSNDDIKYTCRSCKKEFPCDDTANTCVYQKNYGGNVDIYYEMFVNKYTKHDPTLPHLNNLQCANSECVTNQEGTNIKSDIIYIRYDESKMKYIYLCCNCDKAWIHPEYQKTVFIQQ